MDSTEAAGIRYQWEGDGEGGRSWPQGSIAAAGHWCIHVAGLVASSLQAVAPEQTAMRWRSAVWPGTVLASWDRGS